MDGVRIPAVPLDPKSWSPLPSVGGHQRADASEDHGHPLAREPRIDPLCDRYAMMFSTDNHLQVFSVFASEVSCS